MELKAMREEEKEEEKMQVTEMRKQVEKEE